MAISHVMVDSRWRMKFESGISGLVATPSGGMLITYLNATKISIIPPPPSISPPRSTTNNFADLPTMRVSTDDKDASPNGVPNEDKESLQQWQQWYTSMLHMQLNSTNVTKRIHGIRGITIPPSIISAVYISVEHGIAAIDMTTGKIVFLTGQNGKHGFCDGDINTALFAYPRGIAIHNQIPASSSSSSSSPSSKNESIAFVADSVEGLIRRIDLSTLMVSTVAGVRSTEGTRQWPLDGIGLQSTFKCPSAISYDAHYERLWIGDNSALRMMQLSSSTYDVITVPLIGDGAPLVEKSDWAAILCWRSHILFIADCARGIIVKVDLRGKRSSQWHATHQIFF
jgi:hypothetical protein